MRRLARHSTSWSSRHPRSTSVLDAADVVFPVAAAAEKAGTFLNWEGRERRSDARDPHRADERRPRALLRLLRSSTWRLPGDRSANCGRS